MKTGRLIKFQRPGADVHAYVYREGNEFRASIFILAPGRARQEPLATLSGPTEPELEAELRAWVDAQYPARTP
jgi:hypothetical protein